jgi:Mn2+/Fe2+ NRAMP family transporter
VNSGNGAPMSLALLALLTSAVVVMMRGNEFFTLWDSVIGLIVLSVAVLFTIEAIEEFVEGSWPQLRRPYDFWGIADPRLALLVNAVVGGTPKKYAA